MSGIFGRRRTRAVFVALSMIVGSAPGQFAPGQFGLVQFAWGQIELPGPNGKKPTGGEPKSDDSVVVGDLRRHLEAGRRAIGAEQYIRAVSELQTVLDAAEDRTTSLTNDPAVAQQSLKYAALTSLRDLAAAGRKEYETQFGPVARKQLDLARESGTREDLAIVVRRFFHTQAGYQATFLMARDDFDRCRWLDAALYFDRLKDCPWAARQFEPELSLKGALAWLRGGDQELARQWLVRLKSLGIEQVELAGRKQPIFSDEALAVKWLEDLTGAVPELRGPADWLLVGGDVRRSAHSRGATPYLNQGWRNDTIKGSTSKTEQDDALQRTLTERQNEIRNRPEPARVPMIPSPQPILVGNRVVCRTLAGLRAFDAQSGDTLWASSEKDPALERLLPGNVPAANRVGNQMTPALFVTNRAWRDSTFGTLSSDGTYVFAVEESLTASPVNMNRARMFGMSSSADNRLVAYDVKTGGMIWEIGAPEGDKQDPNAGAFFLGPPLPMGNQLYALVDVTGDLRLVCLSPRSGRTEWSQSLTVTAQPEMLNLEPMRRNGGLSPTYANGIMLCPTEANELIGFELATRSLLWRFRYAQEEEGPAGMARIQMQFQRQNRLNAMASGGMPGNDTDRWLDGLAIASDQRVLITPRDSNELLCLDQRTGAVHWKAPRGEGLFLAGVHDGHVIVVSTREVTALNIVDGKEAWAGGPVPIATPSGRGYISRSTLFLPLSTGAVVAIDLVRGTKGPESSSREGKIPGNLVATPDAVVTQGVDFVAGFRPFAALEQEVISAIEKNPKDAVALTLRGEIRLQRGETGPAYEDFLKALELKPDDEHTRQILVRSLLEGLRTDFKVYRDRTEQIEALISDPAQKSTFVQLVAAGFEKIGDRPAAFKAYLRFAQPGLPDEPASIDGNTVSLRTDRLVRSRLLALYAEANEDERKLLLTEVHRQFDLARGKFQAAGAEPDAEALRRFITFFGVWNGTAAESQLAELSQEAKKLLAISLEKEGRWLELEFWLRQQEQSADKRAAAEATGKLALLLAGGSRPQDVAPVVKRLEGDLAGVPVRGEQTGMQLASELRGRPELPNLSAPPAAWPVGTVQIERQPIPGNPRGIRWYSLPIRSSRGLFFTDVSLQIEPAGRELTARDRDWQPLWKVSLGDGGVTAQQLYSVQIVDHLVVLQTGAQVMAIDTLGTAADPSPRVLWKHALMPLSNRGGVNMMQVAPNRIVATDQMGTPIGFLGAVTASQTYVLRGREERRLSKLVALDTLTGSTVWSRNVPCDDCDISADDEFVFVYPGDNTDVQIYRVIDGSQFGQRVHPQAAAQRLGTSGRNVVTFTSVQGGKLSCTDIVTERELWSHEFAPTARVQMVEQEEIFVLEPGGRFAVVNVADGAKRIDNPQGGVAHPGLTNILVFRTTDRYVIIGNAPVGDGRSVGAVGNSGTIVAGNAYGFDRQTGNRLWHRPLKGYGLDVHQTPHLPVLIFGSMFIDRQPANNRGLLRKFGLACLDTRTGELVYEDERDEPLFFIEPVADPDHGILQLRLYQSELTLKFLKRG